MDTTWVKLDSWHALSEDLDERTVCGLIVEGGAHTSETLPRNEPGCEHCLEAVAVKADVGPVESNPAEGEE